MHVMAFAFLVIVAIVGTLAIFVFWLVVTILRGITRLILGPPVRAPARLPPQAPVVGGVRICGRISCRSLNPVEARFCRRCGQALVPPQQVQVRRAAIL
jgi:hypothetical protein